MPSIDALSERLTEYLDPTQIQKVRRAYFYAAQAHDGQRRKSGEPYVTHPLAVASVLAEMHMDHDCLIAAMLHDVIEDTEINYDGIESQFGDQVAKVVDGVSKLTHLEFESKAEAQAENFQKMVLAMAEDIRVIIVKLADRLHNMRTLGAMRPDKQRRIAKETLDIYAPIAARLGMRDVQVELEDLAFKAAHPMRAKFIRRAVVQARGQRRDVITEIQTAIENRLKQEGLPGSVTGREKHLYSIYMKMKRESRSFASIMDVFAFRIVTNTVDECYRVLGAVHNLFKPVPGRFKDYIAIPKANGYQSLHTDLFGARNFTIEVQIRTKEMDAVAAQGIAEHSHYKSTGDGSTAVGSYSRARKWLQGLLEMQQAAGDSMEFIDSVKKELFPDEVYVFTPKGRILELPQGATPVDFAYAVHTDVGNSCISCRIDRHLSPLSEPLKTGQTVEIITTPRAQPNMAWLNFVVTGKARTSIRHFLKNQQMHESVELGRRLLNQYLAQFDINDEQVDQVKLQKMLEDNNFKNFDELLQDIGLGNRMAYVVARHLRPGDNSEDENSDKGVDGKALVIRGAEGMVMHFARCCHPIPGDSIVGKISAGRGLVVHRAECRNMNAKRDEGNRDIFIEWADTSDEEYGVVLELQVESQRGIIAQLATAVASAEGNVRQILSGEKDGQMNAVTIELMVANRVHLARIMKKLRAIRQVNRVTRT
ncbi:bifunctional GTP diphosphokinase/guanosine-3',5'-bis pyrophosphate 3'-pyrophosphohydrolase [Marinobacterium sp. LSUCC0821]|uniref:bifunctional GTP diphosphokinase/guanosine-3',5'-bis pyrophosphate 3'-pyrophosphohydrolase n=1 Tax=Marinobacterium sp. LSUCC0821 TaxID=2668067 RepID=UPI0014529F19|nr:bifunctional GTP diphosphokinase/guanosine-3',5'-bis pyrophosphate 3'-pyrophosphohydrolase [Marinobacterium sp. LSUCC0821]QJD72384.1 bifunctional GTP diphosphokinase/guanosine-3',5'-bis pyrophosphate 3'-pyrophosphohydrolase [Marinobacterium sp. LSUCC0821]